MPAMNHKTDPPLLMTHEFTYKIFSPKLSGQGMMSVRYFEYYNKILPLQSSKIGFLFCYFIMPFVFHCC